MTTRRTHIPAEGAEAALDVVVVGAGFGGLYATATFRNRGLSVTCLERGDGPGGVWNQNRYPGARVDSNSHFYTLTHDRELYGEWQPREEFSDSDEMRRYFRWLVPRLGITENVRYGADVRETHYDDTTRRWTVRLADGEVLVARYLVLAIGSLNTPTAPVLPGQDDFAGTVLHTSDWPRGPVPGLSGRVGVVGTGSSGIQVATELARTAEQLVVFQRTPQYTMPLRNSGFDTATRAAITEDFDLTRARIFASDKGRPVPERRYALASLPAGQRQQMLEDCWERGGNVLVGLFTDLFTDPEANRILSDFVRSKIRQIVNDPETAELLVPSYSIGAKRVVRDAGFYEAFNRPNVSLVSIAEDPITELSPTGLRTERREFDLDVIVLATGFDAMTGPVFRIDVRGTDGMSLREQWADGAGIETMGGLMVQNFPNLFLVGGVQSPAVHVSVPVLNEYMVDRAAGIVAFADATGVHAVEPHPDLCRRWSDMVEEAGKDSLVSTVDSWYNGGNIAGKPRSYLTYLGGFVAFQAYFDGIDASDLVSRAG